MYTLHYHFFIYISFVPFNGRQVGHLPGQNSRQVCHVEI
jgi:hypothetical protein